MEGVRKDEAPTKPRATWGGSVPNPALSSDPHQNAPPRWSVVTEHGREESLCHLAQKQGQSSRDKGAGTNVFPTSLPADGKKKKRQNKGYNCKPISFSLMACHQGPLPEPLILGTSRSGSERTCYSGCRGVRGAREKGTHSELPQAVRRRGLWGSRAEPPSTRGQTPSTPLRTPPCQPSKAEAQPPFL